MMYVNYTWIKKIINWCHYALTSLILTGHSTFPKYCFLLISYPLPWQFQTFSILFKFLPYYSFPSSKWLHLLIQREDTAADKNHLKSSYQKIHNSPPFLFLTSPAPGLSSFQLLRNLPNWLSPLSSVSLFSSTFSPAPTQCQDLPPLKKKKDSQVHMVLQLLAPPSSYQTT